MCNMGIHQKEMVYVFVWGFFGFCTKAETHRFGFLKWTYFCLFVCLRFLFVCFIFRVLAIEWFVFIENFQNPLTSCCFLMTFVSLTSPSSPKNCESAYLLNIG